MQQITEKEITDHKISKLNREHITVRSIDEIDTDGAHHVYEIIAATPETIVSRTIVAFQKGGLAEAGINGITDQALLAVVIDRLRGFQSGPFPSRENALAITKLEEALLWMSKRYADRAARGVEGMRVV